MSNDPSAKIVGLAVSMAVQHHRSTNITGTVSVSDTGSGGAFKSKLEKHAFIRWMCHPTVESVRLQEPRITYLDAQGTKRRYTGDLFVTFRPRAYRRPLVVECKYSRQLQQNPELAGKLKRVKGAMNCLGRDFLVQTEHDIHTDGFQMMKFVFSHRNNDPHPAQQEILDCMAIHKTLTLGQLLNALREDEVAQCELIPEVWRLVAHHKLTADFREILNHAAKISLPSV